MIDLNTNMVSTVVGTGNTTFNGDVEQEASKVNVFIPFFVLFVKDPVLNSKYLYYTDTGNDRVCKVNLQTRLVTTIMGTGSSAYNGDGKLPLETNLNKPTCVHFDRKNNIYVCDTNNNLVRKVDKTTQIVSTVFGTRQLFSMVMV